jgi:hypothetical protein
VSFVNEAPDIFPANSQKFLPSDFSWKSEKISDNVFLVLGGKNFGDNF